MGTEKTSLRVGCGSGYSRDHASAAVHMAENGEVDYLCCDRLAERTLATATAEKQKYNSEGYNPLLEDWFGKVLPASYEKDITIIGNFGAANPLAAGRQVYKLAKEFGFSDLNIHVITGDDVTGKISDHKLINLDTGERLNLDKLGKMVSANAYIGADPICEALEDDADIIIGGRIGDLSLYLAPMMHELGWEDTDFSKKAAGSTVAHLIECGTHSVGGNLAYPGYVKVPGVDDLGLPLAEVYEDGEAIISQPEGSGGVVTELSLSAQLVYEIHDPANYVTPDVVCDLRDVELNQIGDKEVKVTGSKGKPKPDEYKVLIGIDEGVIGEFECGWAGEDALTKADFTIREVIKPTLDQAEEKLKEVRIDRIGVDSIHGPAAPEPSGTPNEIRLRIAFKTEDESDAQKVLNELEPHGFFAAVGTGGIKRNTERNIGVYPTLIPREEVELTVNQIKSSEGA